MEADQAADADHLRETGAALDGIGTPWLLTLFALSGARIGTGTWIVPLLWFAAPLVVLRTWRAGQGLDESPRRLLLGAAAVGAASWSVSVVASLVGTTEVMQSAFWVGTVVGVVLFCSGMLALTRSLGWGDHALLWRRLLRTFVLVMALGLVAAGLALAGELVPDGRGAGPTLWAWVIVSVAVIIQVVALVRMAKIVSATRAGLLTAPVVPLPRNELFGTAAR